ncbi:PAS domain S-box protein [Biostraticola tofi]|uniref:diguanylate cyclase n=1 Tax=Biostraticola tofi TaxID=466109 RepID=A0A4R3YKK7_9GAMM|nr:PAS domain S-box protein [Biostraticola tofi]TCV91938.1 PAS domain S-box-containing protein/diguanylate cyclase (GGDEF)-like protein [Biostraticola tofi]
MQTSNIALPRQPPTMQIMLIAAAAWVFVLSLVCSTLPSGPDGLKPLWFSTAAVIPILFRCKIGHWPALLVCFGTVQCLAQWLTSTVFVPLIIPILVTLAEAAFAAWLLQRLLNPADPLENIQAWMKFFVTSAILTPMLGGLVAGYFTPVLSEGLLDHVFHWFSAEALGILIISPVGLLYKKGLLTRILHHPRTLLEMVGLLVLMLAVSFMALAYLPFPYTFIILPLLIIAISVQRFEAFSLFLLTMLILYQALSHGVIAYKVPYQLDSVITLNIPLIMVLIPAHCMALAVYTFKKERRGILESETRFRQAMDYSAIGMAIVSLDGVWLRVNKSLCQFLGYSEEQMKTLTFQDITYAEDLTTDLAQLADLVAGKIESYTLEKRYIRRDGEKVWALLAVSMVRDENQMPLYFISQVEDITIFKQTALTNQRLMERVTLANEAGGVGIWEYDTTTGHISWDKRMREIYDVTPEEAPDEAFWFSLIIPEDREPVRQKLDEALNEHKPFMFEFNIRTRHQELRHIYTHASLQIDDNGQVTRMIGVNLDITHVARLTEALYEEKERLHITLDSIGDAVISIDTDLCVVFMNPVAERMTGWPLAQARGKPIDSLLHISLGAAGPRLDTSLQCEIDEGRPGSAIDQMLALHCRNGKTYDVQRHSAVLTNLHGDTLGAVLVIKDVSEARNLMQQLRYNALHDVLTGLPNRANFETQLTQALGLAVNEKRQHILVFLDLDRFKHINDGAGHAAGDQLLIELGSLMQHNVRHDDLVARLGGDEFGFILLDCSVIDAQALVLRVVQAINDYIFHWQGKTYQVGASAGITWITAANAHPAELLRQADTACYAAKHGGRGRVCLHQP